MFRHLTFRSPTPTSLRRKSYKSLSEDEERGEESNTTAPRLARPRRTATTRSFPSLLTTNDSFDGWLSGTLDDPALVHEVIHEMKAQVIMEEGQEVVLEERTQQLRTNIASTSSRHQHSSIFMSASRTETPVQKEEILVEERSSSDADDDSEPSTRFQLSKSFDTVNTEPESESDEDFRTSARAKKIRWAEQLHSLYHFGYEQEAFLRILILLLDPKSKKFEFLHVEIDTSKRLTVSDTLKQLPLLSTNEILSKLEYSVLCMNQTEFIKILPLEHYNLIDGDVLLAIPKGESVRRVKRDGASFLQLRKITKTMTRLKQRGRYLQRLLGSDELAVGKTFVRWDPEEDDDDDDECHQSFLSASPSLSMEEDEEENSSECEDGEPSRPSIRLHPDLQLLEEVDVDNLKNFSDALPSHGPENDDEMMMDLLKIDSIGSSSFDESPRRQDEENASPFHAVVRSLLTGVMPDNSSRRTRIVVNDPQQ